MLWIKAFHVIFMVCWFAGLLYLPRLFVYHTLSQDTISLERFKIMERKLFFGIMTPSALLTIILGLSLIGFTPDYMHMAWLHAKLGLVVLLILYHIYLGFLWHDFKNNRNKHGHVFYRILNEVPIVFLILIVVLVIVKPL